MKYNLILSLCLTAFLYACSNDASQSGSKSDTSAHHHAQMAVQDDSTLVGAMSKMMDKMESSTITGNIDFDFASMMIAHHAGAIDMAEVELKSGSDTAIKCLAAGIIEAQEAEITLMSNIKKGLDSSQAKLDITPVNPFEASMVPMMHSHTALTGNTDKDFVQMMIPHHQSAVDMANVFLSKGVNGELRKLAKQIIQDQTKEIDFFRDWISRHK